MNNIPQENITDFVNYRYKPYDSSKTGLKLFFCWGMLVPFYLIGNNTLLWVIAVAVFNMALTAMCVKERKMLKYYGFLVDGVSNAYIGLLFNLFAYRLYTDYYSENIVVMLLMLMALFMTACLSVIVITSLIKIGKFKFAEGAKKTSVVAIVICLAILKNLEISGLVVVISVFVFSLVCVAISVNGLLKHWLTK